MRKSLFSLFLLVFILIIVGCEQDAREVSPGKAIQVSEFEAKLISHKTAGIIPPDAIIKVIFQENMVEKEALIHTLDKDIFHFDPKISGKVEWKSLNTITFKPDDVLPARMAYEGYLDLSRLFPDKGFPQDKIEIVFETEGLTAREIDANFVLLDKNDPSLLQLIISVDFNLDVDFSDLVKSSALDMNNREIPVNFEQDSAGHFIIKTDKIIRNDQAKEFRLLISRKKLDLAFDIVENFHLPALRDFEVLEMENKSSGENLFIQVKFSDLLDKKTDYRGFVDIEPKVDFKLQSRDNFLIIRGDFERDKTYKVVVHRGMTSNWGTSIIEDQVFAIDFPSYLPQIKFTSGGCFLPSSNNGMVNFNTVNVKEVILQVNRVYANNLGFFLQENSLDGGTKRSNEFWNTYRVGTIVAIETLSIGDQKNEWHQNQLDLNKLFKKSEKGIFLIGLRFDENNILEELPQDWDYWEKRSYFWNSGRIYKPIILSDIALMAKRDENGTHVFVNDVKTTEPIQNAEVKLISYTNQVLSEGKTDIEGKCLLDSTSGNFIQTEYKGQRSVLLFGESRMDLSLFDIGGAMESTSDIRTFVYTDRGVYRPGDSIFMSVIVRNRDNTFPNNHPITMKILNPKNRLIYEETNKQAKDGFYAFRFNTENNALTGNWLAEIYAGDKVFRHGLKIETVVPYRLKVNVDSEIDRLGTSDTIVPVDVESKYLFGAPSGNLDCELSYTIATFEKQFKEYSNFIFTNEAMDFKPIESKKIVEKLDQNGILSYNFDIPYIGEVPCALTFNVDAKVLEKGGRPVPKGLKIPFDPYPYYVGLSTPANRFIQTNKEHRVNAILVNSEGKTVSGRDLTYRIYINKNYWWYDYESIKDYHKRFKNDFATILLDEGVINTGSSPSEISFTPRNYGTILVEVSNGNSGHTAACFFNAHSWGSGQSARDVDLLSLKIDSEKYNPGQTAKVIAETPESGRALLSIEKGNQVLYTKWIELKSQETVLDIPITEEMMPTSYAFLSVFQPHLISQNDRPLRLYGIVPINVEDKKTHLPIEVDVPKTIKPGEEIEVEVSSKDKSQFQYTVAIVDEGLLAITDFQTPDAWQHFYRKIALLVDSYDILPDFIGIAPDKIFKKFSIGGGLSAFKKQLSPVEAKRFEPVALFSGPLSSDSNGKGKVKFTIPDYIGSVRVMVVGADKNRYGNSEKEVQVKSPLMVLPTFPRVLGPGDKIVAPITVFSDENNVDVEVGIDLEGCCEISGPSRKEVRFSIEDEKDVSFELKAKNEIGKCRIKVFAKSADHRFEKEVEIAVRPYSSLKSSSQTKMIKAGESLKMEIPGNGIKGSNSANLTISRLAKIDMDRRLSWLMGYPYGCIEQTVSAAFPQLFLKDIVELNEDAIKKTDHSINSTIDRLSLFQLPSGGFSYWPNGERVNIWGTNYATHFLIEAKKLGYYVPEDLLRNCIDFQKTECINFQHYRYREKDSEAELLKAAYRLYIVALAESPQIGSMNLMKQNYLDKMNNTSKWYLAAAYNLAGFPKTSREIVKGTSLEIRDYVEFAGTYGSSLRDQGIILEMITVMKDYESAYTVFMDIADELSSKRWFSTQTTGYCLLSAGKFIQSISSDKRIEGAIILPDNEKIDFSTDKAAYSLELEDGFGDSITINMKDTAFVTLNWEGIPLKDNSKTESSGLALSVRWLDEQGMGINPISLEQGISFWGHFKVTNPGNRLIEEIALVQVLPSGWEIENTRLIGDFYPSWSSKYNLGREDYQDIRDDRIIWFFDLRHGNNIDFLVKMNTVTAGKFYLPTTQVQAMYNDRFMATHKGYSVWVRPR